MYVDPALIEYAVRLATATRDPACVGLPELARYITYGASPRASINLILAGRALAFLRGRDYALPQDVLDVARDVMRHRMVLSFEALSDDVTADQLLTTILAAVRVPVVPLREPSDVRAQRLSASSSASTGQVVRRLDGLLQGDYRTLFRGNGVDLAGLREYQHGDDVRHIDWNVTARLASAVRPRVRRGPRAHRPGSCSTSARRSTSARSPASDASGPSSSSSWRRSRAC